MFSEYKFRCSVCGTTGQRAVIMMRPTCCDRPMIPVGKPERDTADLVVKPGTICPQCGYAELKQGRTECGACETPIAKMNVPMVPRPKPEPKREPSPQPSKTDRGDESTQPMGTPVSFSDYSQFDDWARVNAKIPSAIRDAQRPISLVEGAKSVRIDWSGWSEPDDYVIGVDQSTGKEETVHNYQTASGDHIGVPDSVRGAIRQEVWEQVAREIWSDMGLCPMPRDKWEMLDIYANWAKRMGREEP